jgi:hypothetical protein
MEYTFTLDYSFVKCRQSNETVLWDFMGILLTVLVAGCNANRVSYSQGIVDYHKSHIRMIIIVCHEDVKFFV